MTDTTAVNRIILLSSCKGNVYLCERMFAMRGRDAIPSSSILESDTKFIAQLICQAGLRAFMQRRPAVKLQTKQ